MELVEEGLQMETAEKQQEAEDPTKATIVKLGGALATRRLIRNAAAGRMLAHPQKVVIVDDASAVDAPRTATPPTEFIGPDFVDDHVRKPGIVRDEAYYGKGGRAKLTPARLAAIKEQERRQGTVS